MEYNPPEGRRMRIAEACKSCARAKKACDEERPCTRCCRLEIRCLNPNGTAAAGAGTSLHRSATSAKARGKDDDYEVRGKSSKRRQITRGSACMACSAAKTACDTYRPCAHCIRKGIDCNSWNKRMGFKGSKSKRQVPPIAPAKGIRKSMRKTVPRHDLRMVFRELESSDGDVNGEVGEEEDDDSSVADSTPSTPPSTPPTNGSTKVLDKNTPTNHKVPSSNSGRAAARSLPQGVMRSLLTDEAFPGHIFSLAKVSRPTFVSIKTEEEPLSLKASSIPPGNPSSPAIAPSSPFALVSSSSSKAPSSFVRLCKASALEKIGIAALLDLSSSQTSQGNSGYEHMLPVPTGLSAHTRHFDDV